MNRERMAKLIEEGIVCQDNYPYLTKEIYLTIADRIIAEEGKAYIGNTNSAVNSEAVLGEVESVMAKVAELVLEYRGIKQPQQPKLPEKVKPTGDYYFEGVGEHKGYTLPDLANTINNLIDYLKARDHL